MQEFYDLCYIMLLAGVIVFVALYFVDAGYGKLMNEKWGPTINNKVGWCLMECPVFLVILFFWAKSEERFSAPYIVFFLLFELHYFHRSFVGPFLMRGNGQIPVTIMAMSIVFNVINGYIQGKFLFELAPHNPYYASLYSINWFYDPRFICGIVIFFIGMIINWHSDYIIRHLRKPGDTKHYLPKGGMYNYVTSANYFGEFVEWTGFAILTWSWAGAVFALWTFANLAPRASRIYDMYQQEFPDQLDTHKTKRMIPFIY